MISEAIRKHFLVILLALLVATVLVYRRMSATKAEKEAEVADIRAQIQTGSGANGVDIKSLLRGIPPSGGAYATTARAAAIAIHDAHGVLDDDEQAVFAAFQNKTIYQIAAVVQQFQLRYGLDIDLYLHNGSYLSEFLSLSEYQQVVGIVQAARTAARV